MKQVTYTLVIVEYARVNESTSPGTAGGTVRRRAVTVAIAISWLLYLWEQECPAVTILGLSSVPSR